MIVAFCTSTLRGEEMIKKIGIISLSDGILGEDVVRHEVDLGVKRLKDYGIEVEFLPHALKGTDFIKNHPESRAEDEDI